MHVVGQIAARRADKIPQPLRLKRAIGGQGFGLAAQLLGKLPSPSQAASWAETKRMVEDALNSMDAIDREVLALRHFEGLTNAETATVLGLKKSAASNRYVRALGRLKEVLLAIPGLAEDLVE